MKTCRYLYLTYTVNKYLSLRLSPLVSDAVACFPAFVGIPGVVRFPAVAFIPAVAGVSAVAVVPAVDGGFAVDSFPADPGIPMLL
jgi:hypothetical protein